MAQSTFWAEEPRLYLRTHGLHIFFLFFIVFQKIVHDKVYRRLQMELECWEKLFRALKMVRNELHEKLLVPEEQGSV